VSVTNGVILMFLGVDLFLAFGVLAFFLNFIPNVRSPKRPPLRSRCSRAGRPSTLRSRAACAQIGMFTGVILPMPLVALDPHFNTWQVWLAFVLPLLVGMFAKDVLEPVVLGKGTSLHPVSVLLAIMLFGSVWGVTGMVLAVPLTAVMRIYLEAVDHPLSRYAASALSGTSHHPTHTELV
jgi:AI-2 transport protein TqsA